MNKNIRVVVIGLDGATYKIIDPLIKKGKLPFLKKLREKSSGILNSTYPSISAPAWVSFQTGVNPAKHSVFDFFYFKNNEKQIINSNNILTEKIYDYLGREDLKSLLVNFPISYPIRPINGTLISSFLTPKGKEFVYPSKYKKYLKKIDYEIDLFSGKVDGLANNSSLTNDQKKDILEKLKTIAKKRIIAFKKLYKDEVYDFSFLLFKGTDIIQHIDYDGKLTENYYQYIDKLIADLHFFVSKGDEKIIFFVISDHGFHKVPEWEFYPYKWFKKEFNIKQKNITEETWSFLHSLNKLFKKIGINFSNNLYLSRLRQILISRSNVSTDKLADREIRFDVKGVYIGNGYTDVEKEKILVSMRQLKYKNKKVFKNVEYREKLFNGRFLKDAPDIVWLTNNKFVVNPITTVEKTFREYKSNLVGEHYSDRQGIWMADGYGLKRNNQEYEIIDLLPTLLYLYGINITEKIDGNLMDIFNKKNFKSKFRKILEKKYIDNLVIKQFIDVRNYT